MTTSIETASWCRPAIEGDWIIFRHAYKRGREWFDIQVSREGMGAPNREWIGMRLQEIQRVALEQIFPHLSGLQTVSYSALPAERCDVDGVEATGDVLHGMREIDRMLNERIGGVSFTQSAVVRLKSFHRSLLPAPPQVPPPEAAPIPSQAWIEADFIKSVDAAATNERFDPNVSYAQFQEGAKQQPNAAPIYQAYLKVVTAPTNREADAVRMRRWLEALHQAAVDYLQHHPVVHSDYKKDNRGCGDFVQYCKKRAAEALINFISVPAPVKELVDHLSQ